MGSLGRAPWPNFDGVRLFSKSRTDEFIIKQMLWIAFLSLEVSRVFGFIIFSFFFSVRKMIELMQLGYQWIYFTLNLMSWNNRAL